MAKIDPVETFYSVGSSLFGRILLFFAAGWVGLLLGRVAAAFQRWDDFLIRGRGFRYLFDDLFVELGSLLFWPIIVLFSTASDNVALFFLLLTVSGVGFFLLVWTEEPVPLCWLAMVAVTSLVPVFVWEPFRVPALLVLVFFWAGLSAAAWWALQRDHPEVIDAVGGMMQGRAAEPDSEADSKPRRKAPPNTWPKGVEGFEEEED